MSLIADLARLRVGRSAPALLFSFCLHVATGFIAVAAHYGVMWMLLRGGVPPVAASSLAFPAGALTRFLLSYYGVFVPQRGVAIAGGRFVLAILLQLALNTLLLAGLLGAGLPVWRAQVVTTVALTFLNYVVYRLWVFR